MVNSPSAANATEPILHLSTFTIVSSSPYPFCYPSLSDYALLLWRTISACHSFAPLRAGSFYTAAVAGLAIPSVAADKKPVKEPVAETPSYYGPQPTRENLDLTVYARIREEGFKHSHVMEFADALTNGIGPRLTGSPNMTKANEWTRDTLTEIGLRTRTWRTGASSVWDGCRSIHGDG